MKADPILVIRDLRRNLGVTLGEAKRAVDAVGPDYDRAVEWLRGNVRMPTPTPNPLPATGGEEK